MKDITRDKLELVTKAKLREGVTPTTVNRMLEIVRAILRKAEREWEWIEKSPPVRMLKVNNKRIRWITRNEAERLVHALPEHLSEIVTFSLATGLRMSNVTGLQWQDINMLSNHAWIHPDKAKVQKAIPVPLNSIAMEIIKRQLGKHQHFVFAYKGKPINRCNTKAWKKGVLRAGLKDFRWHDLRHTWASWHVQSGTSLQELQQLGGWSSFDMVLRYAHLSSDHLKDAAERITVTNLLQPR